VKTGFTAAAPAWGGGGHHQRTSGSQGKTPAHTAHICTHGVCTTFRWYDRRKWLLHTHAHTEPNFFYRGENMAYVLYLSKYVL